MTHLTDAPIDTADLIRRTRRPSDGACVVFEGVVRDHHEGRSVESIFYEAYRPMAEKEIAKIARQIESELPTVAVTLVHRLGNLHVGEASIVIVCTSPHRAEAFTACRNVLDRVKETVPIWKKERGPEREEWVGWQS